MQFSAVYGMVLAFALGVAAHGAPSVHQDKTQCPGDQISCCINKSDIKGDGVLDNLLARGLISNLLGASDQACAKTELIGEINILGMFLSSISPIQLNKTANIEKKVSPRTPMATTSVPVKLPAAPVAER